MFFSLWWYVFKRKIRLQWKILDILILGYILTMILVSIFTTWIAGIVYWGRYDFSFLLAFWLLYHGSPLLARSTAYYIKTFLVSWWVMLFLSGLLKWPLTEDILLHFWYCGNPSNWHACNGVPPIFHGIEWAHIRRFQGLLDGPNTMWGFLIFFGGLFIYYMRMKKKWYFITGIVLLILLAMIIYTYSRSALLWAIGGIFVAIIWSIPHIWKYYKKEASILVLISMLGLWILWIKYSTNMQAIIGREWSTKWHYERMIMSIERFRENPLGQGLGSSWPAYRHVIDDITPENMVEKDAFYIPESWYIQQFVEWWIFGGILFLSIMISLFFILIKKSVVLWGMLVWVGIMNLFLHTFESSVLVLPMFMLIGLILSEKRGMTKTQ